MKVSTTRWSSASDQDQFAVDNPATGQPVAVVQGSGPQQVDRAVKAAHAGHLDWKQRPARQRGHYLRKVAEVIRAHADEIAALESLEMGKPITQARHFDVEAAIGIFDYFASMVEVLPSGARDYGPVFDVTTLEPFGVIAGIVPFNWPPIHTAGKAAPALAVGNAIVLKPPEQTPSVVLRMVELIGSVLPDDVVHVVPGAGAVGAALAGHPLVGKVSFTGSPTTGSAVLRTAADNLTPTLMELGGKNPLLVFDDADLYEALLAAVDGGFFNQGEACTAASRKFWCRTTSLPSSNAGWPARWAGCGWAMAPTPPPRSDHSSPPRSRKGCWTTSTSARQRVLASPLRRRCPVIRDWRTASTRRPPC